MRRTVHILTAALLCVGLQSWAQDITTDFDTEYDFSQIRAFAWGEEVSAPGNELSRKRLEEAIMKQLAARGIELAEQTPDVLVSYAAVVDQETKKRAVNLGVGVSRRVSKRSSVRVGASTAGAQKTVEIGTLVIDIRDAGSGDLVWTATSADTLKGDPDKREAQVRSALEKMFSAFPPSS
jgi:hypothetical protein